MSGLTWRCWLVRLPDLKPQNWKVMLLKLVNLMIFKAPFDPFVAAFPMDWSKWAKYGSLSVTEVAPVACCVLSGPGPSALSPSATCCCCCSTYFLGKFLNKHHKMYLHWFDIWYPPLKKGSAILRFPEIHAGRWEIMFFFPTTVGLVVFCCIPKAPSAWNIDLPGTQMGPLGLIGVWALFWEGWPSKIEVKNWVPGVQTISYPPFFFTQHFFHTWSIGAWSWMKSGCFVHPIEKIAHQIRSFSQSWSEKQTRLWYLQLLFKGMQIKIAWKYSRWNYHL